MHTVYVLFLRWIDIGLFYTHHPKLLHWHLGMYASNLSIPRLDQQISHIDLSKRGWNIKNKMNP